MGVWEILSFFCKDKACIESDSITRIYFIAILANELWDSYLCVCERVWMCVFMQRDSLRSNIVAYHLSLMPMNYRCRINVWHFVDKNVKFYEGFQVNVTVFLCVLFARGVNAGKFSSTHRTRFVWLCIAFYSIKHFQLPFIVRINFCSRD